MFGKAKPKTWFERVKDGWTDFKGNVEKAVMGGAREGAKLGVREAVKHGVRDAVKEGIILEAQRQGLGREDALLSENEPSPAAAPKAARKLARKRELEPM